MEFAVAVLVWLALHPAVYAPILLTILLLAVSWPAGSDDAT